MSVVLEVAMLGCCTQDRGVDRLALSAALGLDDAGFGMSRQVQTMRRLAGAISVAFDADGHWVRGEWD